jgi:hypothetical protein
MNPGKYEAAIEPGRAPDLIDQRRNARRLWTIVTTLLGVAVFIEAVFAGAMLSGADWARAAHRDDAFFLIISMITAGLVCLFSLRGVPRGPRLGFTLLSLGLVVFLQAAMGGLARHGVNLLWLHVPLGVALAGFAARAVATARRLGE